MTVPLVLKRRNNFLWLGIIPSALFLCICLFAISWMHKIHMDNLVQSELNATFRMFYGEVYQEARLLRVLAEELGQNKEIQAAFLSGDRARLQKLTVENFRNDHTKYNITHLYFINQDRACFLRMHKPEEFGDIVDRYTLKEAERKGEVTYGLELGVLGTLTMRVVSPWMVDGRKIGYIEFGVEAEEIVDELKKIVGNDAVLLVDKSRLERKQWEEGMRMLGRPADWGKYPESVKIYSTLQNLPNEIGMSIQRLNRFGDEPKMVMEIGGRSYMAGFTPLLDAADQDIGDLVILKDISALKFIETRMTVLLLGGYAFCVLLFMIFVFWYVDRLKSKFAGTVSE